MSAALKQAAESMAMIVRLNGFGEDVARRLLYGRRDAGEIHQLTTDEEIDAALADAIKRMAGTSIFAKPVPEIEAAEGFEVKNASELLGLNFLPVQWAIRGIIPEGVSILSGDPKIGKSWLLYQACVAIATGAHLWPGREPETQGDVLMLALEDNDRRLKRRLEKLLPRFARMKGTRFEYPDVALLHYETEWPRAEAGVARIATWLRSHPNCRLVVIDTVSAFRDPDPGRKSAYATDYAVGEMLKPLAKEFSCAIVLVMHNRKATSDDPLQMVSGTQGMTGGVDNVLVMKRERGQMDAALYVDGRDIEEQQELALTFSDGYWSSDGRSVEAVQMSKERRAVMDVVETLGPKAKSKDICDSLHPRKAASVRKMLTEMVQAGQLKNVDGLYVPTH